MRKALTDKRDSEWVAVRGPCQYSAIPMPELPEVEIARRNLERWLIGRAVVNAEAEESRAFRGADRHAFKTIRGSLVRAARKGKYLLMTFENSRGLLAHLGMTGKFVRRPKGAGEPFSRARLLLDNGDVIHFRDPRRFGRLEPLPVEQLWISSPISELGPDPLNDPLSGRVLEARLSSSKQALKVALMDQTRIAGLGNIHAAEALYRAKLHPARPPRGLKSTEWNRLARAIRETIDFAIRRQTAEEIEYVEEPGSENPFLVYGRKSEACKRCRTRIKSFIQAGRTTFFCPNCQPRRAR